MLDRSAGCAALRNPRDSPPPIGRLAGSTALRLDRAGRPMLAGSRRPGQADTPGSAGFSRVRSLRQGSLAEAGSGPDCPRTEATSGRPRSPSATARATAPGGQPRGLAVSLARSAGLLASGPTRPASQGFGYRAGDRRFCGAFGPLTLRAIGSAQPDQGLARLDRTVGTGFAQDAQGIGRPEPVPRNWCRSRCRIRQQRSQGRPCHGWHPWSRSKRCVLRSTHPAQNRRRRNQVRTRLLRR